MGILIFSGYREPQQRRPSINEDINPSHKIITTAELSTEEPHVDFNF